jgi:hypothetical protein
MGIKTTTATLVHSALTQWARSKESRAYRERQFPGYRNDLFLNRYFFGLLIVTSVATIDWIWVIVCRLPVSNKWVIDDIKLGAASICCAFLLFVFARIRRYSHLTKWLRCDDIAFTLIWVVLLLEFVISADLLQYLSVTVDARLIDENLIQFDNALGFHWLEFYRWIRSRPELQRILAYAYFSFFLQLIFVPITLGMSGRRDRLSEFVILFMVSTILVILISMCLPASSAFLHFGILDPGTSSSVSDFYLLRSGAMRVIDAVPTQGMISLPSLHTVAAILCIYAVRDIRILFPLSIILNSLMIFSTPTQGGHYLADVFAGLLLSALAIIFVRKLLSPRQSNCIFSENAVAEDQLNQKIAEN